jgi:hypothetical protein
MIIQNNNSSPFSKSCLIGVAKVRKGSATSHPTLGSVTHFNFKNGENPVLDFGAVSGFVSKRLCTFFSNEQGSHSANLPYTNDPIQSFGTIDTMLQPLMGKNDLTEPSASTHHEMLYIIFPDHVTEGAIAAKGYIDSSQVANKTQAANKREENLLHVFFPVSEKQKR